MQQSDGDENQFCVFTIIGTLETFKKSFNFYLGDSKWW